MCCGCSFHAKAILAHDSDGGHNTDNDVIIVSIMTPITVIDDVDDEYESQYDGAAASSDNRLTRNLRMTRTNAKYLDRMLPSDMVNVYAEG